jgi:hypothetical protein
MLQHELASQPCALPMFAPPATRAATAITDQQVPLQHH